jgi:hypothetical protein
MSFQFVRESCGIKTLALAALLSSAKPTHADLVGWWDFEEGVGTTTADQSGGGHTGTLGAGATWSTTEFAPVPSGSTASIAFDGTDLAHVLMNGYKADEVGGTNSRTLAAWIKSAPEVTPATSNLGIFGYGENVAGDKWNFRTQNQNGPIDGNIRVEVNGGYIIGSTVVIDNEWHHVAMTWEDDGTPDVTDVLLYVDGVLEAISLSLDEVIHTDTGNGIDLAISDDHSNREWNGWLDDIRIYDEVLSPERILELATGTPALFNSFTADDESIPAGGAVTLSWEVNPAFDTLVMDNGIGDVAPMTTDGIGSIALMPVETTTYSLTAALGGEVQSLMLTIHVGEVPEISSFEITGPNKITAGGSTTLEWSTFGADSLSLAPVPGDVTGETSVMVSAADTTVYTLTATNATGSSMAQVTLTIVPPGLLAHFNFEEGAGMTTTDVSGNELVGNFNTIGGTGPVWNTTDVPPLLAGTSAAVEFDGIGDRIIVTGYKVPELSGTTSRTLMAWVKSRGASPNGAEDMGLLAFGQDQLGDKWIFRTENDNGPTPGGLRVEVNGGYIVSTTNIVDATWHHVAMTFEDDGTPDVEDILLYVDGQLETPSVSLSQEIHTDTANGIDLTIGDDHSGRKWDGWIDDVRIYNYALTQVEIEEARLGGEAAPFQITSAIYDEDAGSVMLTWNSSPGRTYAIDFSEDLTINSWSEAVDSVLSGGTETTFTVTGITAGTTRIFHRVREE